MQREYWEGNRSYRSNRPYRSNRSYRSNKLAMRNKRLILLILVAMTALAHRSDGQQAQPVAEQLRLAGVMPRGAMVYVQATDLGALMKTWLASPVRSHFYDSASFAAFQKSRVYLKLQDRKKDFESAIGVGLDENRLAELAGRASAVSIYDIGKIEIVFVTEVPRARAVASTLFKQAPQFQERSADGISYYVRDVTTDGGRLNEQFCFAYIEGKLIVTTTEGLMIRAIGNVKTPGAESLLPEVVGLAEGANGFAAHDATMWLDQTRLNHNRYFDNYWIHHNASGALAGIESGLIDLKASRDGLTEQRWFKVGNGSRGLGTGSLSAEDASALMRFAPADAQLIEVHAGASDGPAPAVEQALFGRLPNQSWSPPEIPDHTRSSGKEDENTRAQRYSRLDARFDVDVDDAQAPKRGPGSGGQTSEKRRSNEPAANDFVKSAGTILTSLASGAYSELARSKTEAGKPFVRFERAVVIQLKPDATLNHETLERAITDELRARFVVAGTEPKLAWQDDGAVRFVAQTLLQQGAAYSVSGGFLVVASSKEFASDILQAAKQAPKTRAPATGPRVGPPVSPLVGMADAPVTFYAVVRVAAAKPVFDTLMSKLDGRAPHNKSARKDDEEDHDIKFFSENLPSLIAASAIGEVRLSRQLSGQMMTERVFYSW
jgi:hypothetical protein